MGRRRRAAGRCNVLTWVDEAACSSGKSAYQLPVYSLGVPACNLDRAPILADEMEDKSIVAELEMRK